MEAQELVERYVFAVEQQLPVKKRKDISDELRSSLWDTLEDRFGKQPSLEQSAELLKEFGSPKNVAASYWPEAQYLVGPQLFPIYRSILNVLVVVWLILGVVSLVVTVVFGEQLKPFEWLADLIQGFVSLFGGFTLVFAILQRVGVKDDEKKKAFDPLKLPKVENEDLVSRPGQLAAFSFGFVFLALFAYIPSRLDNLLPGATVVRSPAVAANMGWIIVVILLGMLLDLILLVRGRWSLFTRLGKIFTNLFGMLVIGMILNSPLGLVEVSEIGSEVAHAAKTGVTVTLALVLVIISIDTVSMLYGILKRYVFGPMAER